MALLGSTIGLIYRVTGDVSHAERSISQLSSKVDKEAAQMGGAFRRGTVAAGAFSTALGVTAADAVAKLGAVLISGGKSVLDYSARLQQLQISMESLTGSSAKANKLLEEIRQLSLKSPFEFEGLATLGQRLAGANVALIQIPTLITDIGNVVAATGATTQERLEGVTVAIAQMISKGKVSAEEMEQLAERQIPAWQLLSEATGKPISVLRKMAEEGKLTSDVMVKALQKISREKYGDAMQKQAGTFTGAMTTIKNVVLQTASTLFEPLFKEITKMASRFAKEIQSKGKDFESIGTLIAEYVGEGIGKAIPALAKSLVTSLIGMIKKTFTGEWTGLGFYGIDALRGAYKGVGFNQPIGDIPNNIQMVPTAPDPMLTVPGMPKQTGNVDTGPTKEQLEKQRQDRLEMLKKQAEDLKRFNDLRIEQARQAFESAQDNAETMFESGQTSLQQFIGQSWELIEQYATQVRAAMAAAHSVSIANLSGQALQNEQLSYRNSLEKFNAEINSLKGDLYKQQNATEQKASEERLANVEAENRRRLELTKSSADQRLTQLKADLDKNAITELQYARASAAIRLYPLELERDMLKEQLTNLDKKSEKYAETVNRIKILDAEVSKQQIENAADVEEALKKVQEALMTGEEARTSSADNSGTAGDFNPAGGSPGVGLMASIRELLGLGGQLPTLASSLQAFGEIAMNAFNGIANAIGSVIENWVLMGETGPAMFRKILASALAAIAAESAVRAIFELAKGFAALFFNPAEAAAHFKAAALFGSIAVGSAVAGRLVAGDAFKRQTADNTGTASSSAGSSAEAGAYSGQKDGTITQGRNAPAGALQNSTLTLKVDDRSGWFSKIFKMEWENNSGGLRTYIMKDLAKA